jgi:hypothetical protein
MAGNDPFLNRAAPLEVFMQHAVDAFRGDAAIPNAFGIDQEDGAALTNPQAIGLAAEGRKAEVFEALFEMQPTGFSLGAGTTVRSETKEQVVADAGQSEGFQGGMHPFCYITGAWRSEGVFEGLGTSRWCGWRWWRAGAGSRFGDSDRRPAIGG